MRKNTHKVLVGGVAIGGGAPIVVQSMTNTPTRDAPATAAQIRALIAAGSELVRFTVNNTEAAGAVPEIARMVRDSGPYAPLVGDFHFNAHLLLRDHPECARFLDKYRINPGNVGRGASRDDHFAAICAIAVEHGKPVRIGVNAGSLDPELVRTRMEKNAGLEHPRTADAVLDACMVESALQSTDLALSHGLREDQIIISCKTSRPTSLLWVYRELDRATRQPLHLGLTEAGPGMKGMVWSAASLAPLLDEGIGDTIRVSLTPQPGAGRCEEVYAACELLQALELRSFFPSLIACPGCGRTASEAYLELARRTDAFLRERGAAWRASWPGAANLKVAVMGCVVNGPGESRAAHIGVSLPGAGEQPQCPVYVDGELRTRLQGDVEALSNALFDLMEDYVRTRAKNSYE